MTLDPRLNAFRPDLADAAHHHLAEVGTGRVRRRGAEGQVAGSRLDVQHRAELRTEIARLHRRLGATFIYVTHDQVEAMTMADRIAVLNHGRIVQVGGPGPADHPAASHKVVYTLNALSDVFASAGFKVVPLEWCDDDGRFHATDWDERDGFIYRSARFDHRNITLEVPEFADGCLMPTGENLARFIFERVQAALHASGLSMPAKKVTMALHSLITSQFPRDYMGIVGFSEVARVLTAQGLHEEALDGYRRWLEDARGTAAERDVVRMELANALFYSNRFDDVPAALRPSRRCD